MEDILKKNKIYILISIIIFICFLGTAALCNQCSLGTLGEAEITVEEDESTTTEEIEAEDTEASESAEKEKEEPAEEEKEVVEEEEFSEEEVTEETEEVVEEEVTEEDMEAPTIELEVYEGPVYSSADNVCYYRVMAVVTGNPSPDVEFSKDDSSGAWGLRKSQVNLSNPSDTYTLTATATNSEGSDSDSINLSWGCNRPPEIADIVMMGDHFVGVTYNISVSASDPDGDTLLYNWSVSGGSLNSTTGNSVEWKMPATAGNYQITIEVDDGNGGTDIRTESIEVKNVPGPPIDVDLSIVSTEGGDISNNQPPLCGSPIHRVGDCLNNYTYKGCISFDITGLSGTTVNSAKLTVSSNNQQGNLSNFKPLSILSVNWGVGLPSDFNMFGVIIGEASYHNFIVASSLLKNEIQNAINDGEQRFQIMLAFSGMATDNDNDFDMWIYNDSDIVLSINYNN